MPLALFDFDGTLCPGDSIVPYLRYCVRRGVAPRRQWLRAVWGYLTQIGRPERIAHAKARTLSFIRGKSEAEMHSLGLAFAREQLLPRLIPETRQALERLKAAGYTVVILSASPSVYMDAVAELLPVDAVLSTPCETADRRFTGAVGPNCRGEEKPRRLADWAAARGEALDFAGSVAYGDSKGDLPMMRLCEQRYFVRRKSRGWTLTAD